jgi:hypothetical protein
MSKMAAVDPILEKVDIIRARFPISYREAYDVLERNGHNVVRALMELEDAKKEPSVIEQIEERFFVMGHELADKLRELVQRGQKTKIRVVRDGQTVMTLPAAVGAVGALFFPMLTVFATVAAMTQKYEIIVDKREANAGREGRSAKGNRPLENDRVVCEVDVVPDVAGAHQPGVVNVHHEEREATEYCGMEPSVSAGKVGSI